MKILMLLDNLSDRCGANVEIAYELATEWVKLGHELYCITRVDAHHPLSDTRKKIFAGIWTVTPDEDDMLLDMTSEAEWLEAKPRGKIVLCLKHPVSFLYFADKKLFSSFLIWSKYAKLTKKIGRSHDFDSVIAVTEPYYLAFSLSDSGITCDKYLLMLDPYSQNHTLSTAKKAGRIRREKRVVRQCRKVFALDFVWNEMDYLGEMLRKKTYKFGLPKIKNVRSDDINISELDADSVPDECISDKTDGGRTFVYSGQFYDDIRNPEFLFRLFAALPSDYRLVIYGGGSERTLKYYREVLGDKLILQGWQDQDTVRHGIEQADYLINLNNSISNMLPSKLVEYIDTGKPILNICKLRNCPSLEYMQRYPNGISIFEDDGVSDAVIRQVTEFSDRSRGVIADHDLIMELYPDCICDRIARDMADMMEQDLQLC